MAGVVSHMLGDFAGSVAPTTYVNSIQHGTITIASGASSNTATINAVGSLAWVVFEGFTCSSATSQSAIIAPRISLANTTTVSAARNSSDASTITVHFAVIDATSLLVESVEQGTVLFTATTSASTNLSNSYDLTRTAVFYLGDISSDTSAVPARRCNVRMAAVDTVTATSNSSHTGTCGYVVVQFKAAAIQSIQQFNDSYTSLLATDPKTISAVTMANTMIAWGGINTGGSGYYTTQLTSTTNINFIRIQTSSAARIPVITVIEFVAGVLNSVQRGTISLANATSNTASITAVSATKALCNFVGYNSTSTDTVDKMYQRVTLTNTTTVTASINTNSASAKAIAYEIAEFL